MPAMDGLELVDVIRRHDENSVVLFVSSHNEFLGVGYTYDVQNFYYKTDYASTNKLRNE